MKPFTGVWVDVLTPLRADRKIDQARLALHLRTVAAKGVDTFVLFGQAGEGASFAAREKLTTLEFLREQGFELPNVMLGIQNSALPEAEAVIRAAHHLGVRRFLIAPPMYVYPVQQSGICRYFRELVDDLKLRDVSLYVHLLGQPGPSEIQDAALAEISLLQPQGVAGLVDQGRSLARTVDYVKAFGETWQVMPCFEGNLNTLKLPGVISVQANLMPRAVLHVLKGAAVAQGTQVTGMKVLQSDDRLQALIALMGDVPEVVFYKHLLMHFYQQPEWALTRAPHAALDPNRRVQIDKVFKNFTVQADE